VTDDWQIVRLVKEHRRDAFDCGADDLNQYLRRFARQNGNKGLGRSYVAVLPGETVVRGYYSLTTSAVACESIPEEARKKLPRYPVPTALISRLAVDRSMQGRGLGRDLLMDAIYRVIQAADSIGIYAVEVDAKDGAARTFYGRYGFASLLDHERHMFLSLAAARRAFA
jgi:GNAT superfamily N-acetyltransferase